MTSEIIAIILILVPSYILMKFLINAYKDSHSANKEFSDFLNDLDYRNKRDIMFYQRVTDGFNVLVSENKRIKKDNLRLIEENELLREELTKNKIRIRRSPFFISGAEIAWEDTEGDNIHVKKLITK